MFPVPVAYTGLSEQPGNRRKEETIYMYRLYTYIKMTTVHKGALLTFEKKFQLIAQTMPLMGHFYLIIT